MCRQLATWQDVDAGTFIMVGDEAISKPRKFETAAWTAYNIRGPILITAVYAKQTA